MNTIDKAVMIATGALMFAGIVLAGIVEILTGQPFSPVPMTNEAGEVIAQPAIDPQVRVGLVVLAILILALWSIYKVAWPALGLGEAPVDESMTAD
jgi:hypothetical protein